MAAEGKRRWLGQERNKNNFNNDLPALIFVSGNMQALSNASPMDPIIEEPSPRVVVRLPPRNINIRCYDWSQHQPRQKVEVMFRIRIGAKRQQYASDSTAMLVLTSGMSHGSFARTFYSERIYEIIAKLSQKYHFYLVMT